MGAKEQEKTVTSVIINKYATYVQGLICIDSARIFMVEFCSFQSSPEDIGKYDIDIVIIASKYSADHRVICRNMRRIVNAWIFMKN